MSRIILVVGLVLWALPAPTVRAETPPTGAASATSAVGRQGMVVTVSAPATEVGLATLKQGGNSVDAAVATAFALAVTYPEAGNIGGGGFMLIRPSEGPPECVDYREMAPAATTPEMLAKDPNRLGAKIAGVPGTVRGLALAHHKYGSLGWKELVMPAARLAEDGFEIDAALAQSLEKVLAGAANFPELRRVYGSPGGHWRAGDRLVQKDLAVTLRRIADDGPDAFYTGVIADQIATEMRAGGGLITKADLAAYEAKLRTPIHGVYRGYELWSASPPSSGGTALIEALNILENFDLKKMGRWSAPANHLIVEAMRRAFRDRAMYLGDPDFVKIPERLTTKAYAATLAKGIDPRHATPSKDLAGNLKISPESAYTTHFSIMDAHGMAVSNTYTLEQWYGSRVVVRGAGFLLNNQMGDFNPRPDHTDTHGYIGTPPNTAQPRKRMLSSMAPLIVTKDNHVVLVTGSPGGRTIINTVLCVTLGVLEFDQDLRSAVDSPRWHHQWFPDRLHFETPNDPRYAGLLNQLRAMGHTISTRAEEQGDAHSIQVKDGEYIGVADRRISGSAAGY